MMKIYSKTFPLSRGNYQMSGVSANNMDETNSLSEIEKLKTLLQSADLPSLLHDKFFQFVRRLYHGGS